MSDSPHPPSPAFEEELALSAAFTARVAELRDEKGFSQARLARNVGVTESWLWRIQSNPRKITLALIMRLSRALAVTPDELLAGLPAPTSSRTQLKRSGR